MSSRRRALTTPFLLVLLTAGCSSTTAPVGASLQAPTASASGPTLEAALPPELLIPVASDLVFPKGRRLPIAARVAPDAATPELVIDAFLDVVHDPALRYRVESTERWSRGGDELLLARRVDHDGADRYLRWSATSGLPVEAIVQGDEAVVRQGTGPWMQERAEFLRQMDDLSSSVVIGDLGPEPGGGHRLAIAASFDSVPRAMIESDGNPQDITEIVVDDDGRPLRLTFHRWAFPSIVGQNDFVEGLVHAQFSLVGGDISIPPIDGQSPSTPPSQNTRDLLARTPLPDVSWSVLLPARATTEARELTYYSPTDHAAGLDLTYLVATSDGLRYEVGIGEAPEEVFEDSTRETGSRGSVAPCQAARRTAT